MRVRALPWMAVGIASMLPACSSTTRVSNRTDARDSGTEAGDGTGGGAGSSGGNLDPPPVGAGGIGGVSGFGGASGYGGASGHSGAGPAGSAGMFGNAGAAASGGVGPAGTAGVAGSTGRGGTAGSLGASGTAGSAGRDGGSGTGGTGGASGTAGSGGMTGCPTNLAGPRLAAAGGFCIDSTEVTNAQYAQFLSAKGSDTSGQNAVCVLNQTYVPSAYWPAPTSELDLPVVQVDWCDAYAYCKWAGKRLCGKIGGGANASADYANPDRSQWFRVCSNGGRNVYPYGAIYRPTACNGFNGPDGCNHDTGVPAGTCTLAPVASYPQCQGSGAFSGVYDLSGNVIEWEDSCAPSSDGTEDTCRIRGGSVFARSESDMTCDTDYVNARSSAGPTLGFRCCYP